tara:strand:- start:19950 stop:20141 length:192 start_codon:yes stop_codon:yes gene_type:complete
MTNIISSASKIVFIAMAAGVNAALFTGFITGEQYMVLASMAFTFYFSNKGSNQAEDFQVYGGK